MKKFDIQFWIRRGFNAIAIISPLIVLLTVASCHTTVNKDDAQPETITVNDTVFASPLDSVEYLVKEELGSIFERICNCEKLSYRLVYDNIEKSIYYAKEGLRLSEIEKFDSVISLLNCDLGMVYTLKEVFDTAKIYFDAALLYAPHVKDENYEIYLYNAYGKLYSNQGNYLTSIEYYERARQLAEKIESYQYLATISRNMGILYYDADNFEQAENYILKTVEIYDTKFENPSEGLCGDISDAYSTLSLLYKLQKRGEEAFETAQKAIEYAQKSNNKYFQARAFINLSEVYSSIKKDYDKALEMAGKALELADELGELGDKNVKADVYVDYGYCYYYLGDYAKSKMFYLQSLAMTDPKDLTRRRHTLMSYHSVLAQLKDTEELLANFELIDSLNIVINNQKVQNTLSNLQISYETEKKELKITALEEERQLMLWLGMAGGVVLLLSLATFFFLWRWTVQKRLVSEQQRQLAENRVLQLEKEKQLIATQAVLDGETRERARLARDLHDGLGSLLTGAKLQILEMKQDAKLESVDAERFDKALGLLDNSVQEMRRVAHHLMPDSLSRFGLKPAVSDFCSNLPSVHFSYYGDESRLDPNLEVMIYRSIHELINNALKHAAADRIIVQVIQEPDRIAFTVQDNGRGFDPAAKAHGMGLQNIQTRVESYNGIIDIFTHEGEGTEVHVEVNIDSTTSQNKGS